MDMSLSKLRETVKDREASVQFSCSVVSDCLRPHEPQHARLCCPSPTPGVHANPCPLSRWCHPTISSSVIPLLLLPSIFPSIRVFSNESALHIRWPKYWSFSFNISPSNEHPGLISYKMDWLDLLTIQGTLKSLLQHHSSKASIFRHSAFFIVQLSHPYMTTGKTIALTRRAFVAVWPSSSCVSSAFQEPDQGTNQCAGVLPARHTPLKLPSCEVGISGMFLHYHQVEVIERQIHNTARRAGLWTFPRKGEDRGVFSQ